MGKAFDFVSKNNEKMHWNYYSTRVPETKVLFSCPNRRTVDYLETGAKVYEIHMLLTTHQFMDLRTVLL